MSAPHMDRLRLEAIEKRRQQSSDLIKSRKRKLSDLYYLTRYPTYPINKSGVQTDEDSLMAYLEKNDLESGHTFDESTLPSRAIVPNEVLLPAKRARALYSPTATTSSAPTHPPLVPAPPPASTTSPAQKLPSQAPRIATPSPAHAPAGPQQPPLQKQHPAAHQLPKHSPTAAQQKPPQPAPKPATTPAGSAQTSPAVAHPAVAPTVSPKTSSSASPVASSSPPTTAPAPATPTTTTNPPKPGNAAPSTTGHLPPQKTTPYKQPQSPLGKPTTATNQQIHSSPPQATANPKQSAPHKPPTGVSAKPGAAPAPTMPANPTKVLARGPPGGAAQQQQLARGPTTPQPSPLPTAGGPHPQRASVPPTPTNALGSVPVATTLPRAQSTPALLTKAGPKPQLPTQQTPRKNSAPDTKVGLRPTAGPLPAKAPLPQKTATPSLGATLNTTKPAAVSTKNLASVPASSSQQPPKQGPPASPALSTKPGLAPHAGAKTGINLSATAGPKAAGVSAGNASIPARAKSVVAATAPSNNAPQPAGSTMPAAASQQPKTAPSAAKPAMPTTSGTPLLEKSTEKPADKQPEPNQPATTAPKPRPTTAHAPATRTTQYVSREEFYKRQPSIHQMRQNVTVPDQQVPWYTNPKTVDPVADKDSDVKILVVPNRLPETVHGRRQLTLPELYYTTQALPVVKLLPAAHKALTTETYQLSFLEAKLAVVHVRIEELKRLDRWSLRQHAKFRGPLRLKIHWDFLIDEMKWLQQDFSEERRLKIATCFELSQAVLDYWAFGRDVCCIRTKPVTHLDDKPPVKVVEPLDGDVVMKDSETVGKESLPSYKSPLDTKEEAQSAEIKDKSDDATPLSKDKPSDSLPTCGTQAGSVPEDKQGDTSLQVAASPVPTKTTSKSNDGERSVTASPSPEEAAVLEIPGEGKAAAAAMAASSATPDISIPDKGPAKEEGQSAAQGGPSAANLPKQPAAAPLQNNKSTAGDKSDGPQHPADAASPKDISEAQSFVNLEEALDVVMEEPPKDTPDNRDLPQEPADPYQAKVSSPETLYASLVFKDDEPDVRPDNTMTITPRDLHDLHDANKIDSLVPKSVFLRDKDQSVRVPLKMFMSLDKMDSASREIFNSLPLQKPIEDVNTPYISELESLSINSVTKFLAAPDLNPTWQKLIIEVDPPNTKTHHPLPSDEEDEAGHKHPLFQNDQNKRQIHIRAPQPPNIKYLEYIRMPTIWLQQDDQKLIRVAREFQFNWQVVSATFSHDATLGYTSITERRTPWQCFERWLQLNPNFSLTELKGPYAQQAVHWISSSVKMQAHTKHRISPIGIVNTDSLPRGHSRLRWASMFEAIRKGMRIRESAIRPPNQIPRKPVQTMENSQPVYTPEELSQFKYKADHQASAQYPQRAQQNQMAAAAASGGRVVPVPHPAQQQPTPASQPGATSVAAATPVYAVNVHSGTRVINGVPAAAALPNGSAATHRAVPQVNGQQGVAQLQQPQMRVAMGQQASPAIPAAQGTNIGNGNAATTASRPATQGVFPQRISPEQYAQLLQQQKLRQLQQQQQAAVNQKLQRVVQQQAPVQLTLQQQQQLQMQRAQQQRINATVAAQAPNQQQLNYQQLMLQQQKAQQAKQAATNAGSPGVASAGSPTMSTVPSPVVSSASPASSSPVVSSAPTPVATPVAASPAPVQTPQQQFQVSNLSRAFQFSAQTPQVQTFMNQIAEQNPTLTPEQVSQIAKTQIQRILMQQRMISTTAPSAAQGPASAPAAGARAQTAHAAAAPQRQTASAPGGPVAGMFAVNANTRNIAVTGQQQQQHVAAGGATPNIRAGASVRTTPSPVLQTVRAPGAQQGTPPSGSPAIAARQLVTSAAARSPTLATAGVQQMHKQGQPAGALRAGPQAAAKPASNSSTPKPAPAQLPPGTPK